MDKYTKNMTDEQKKTYYVTKIAKLSSEEYKFITGEHISLWLTVINFLLQETYSNWPLLLETYEISATFGIYCLIAYIINNKQQQKAYDELDKLNNEDRSR